jgi:hypothetical protein
MDLIATVLVNFHRVLFSTAILVVAYIVYRLFVREIMKLKDRKRLEEHIASTIVRLGKWIIGLVVFSAVLA